MTFVSKSPRSPPVYKSTLAEIGRIGPGSYNPHRSSLAALPNPAKSVFHSQLQRSLNLGQQGEPELGPGCYDTREAVRKFVVRKHTTDCGSAFKSGLKRFQHEATLGADANDQKVADINLYQHLLAEDKTKSPGKLYGIARDRTKANNSIPSIPTNQQSYGYRYDQSANKLVQNQNPNLLLAKKSSADTFDPHTFTNTAQFSQGAALTFAKQSCLSHVKTPVFGKKNEETLNTKTKQREEQRQRTLELIYPRQEVSICEADAKKWMERGNILVTKQPRFNQENSHSTKNKLLLSALNRKFHSYLSQAADLEGLIASSPKGKVSKRHNKGKQNIFSSPKVSHEVSYFMSKEPRFHHKVEDIDNRNIQNIVQDNWSKQIQNDIEADQGTPVGFGSNSGRFISSPEKSQNRKIGPGSYQIQSSGLSAEKCYVWSKQQQQRFAGAKNTDAPGPGYYAVDRHQKIKQSPLRKKHFMIQTYVAHPNHVASFVEENKAREKQLQKYTRAKACQQGESKQASSQSEKRLTKTQLLRQIKKVVSG